MTAPVDFRERLHVPLRWWVQGSMFVASLWLAMVIALPGLVAWPLTAVVAAFFAAMMLGYGSPHVLVDQGWLQVGRARIEAEHLGRVEALDADQTRRAAGREADARAFLMLRPADPAPYWLVCTHRPEDLAGAIAALTAAR